MTVEQWAAFIVSSITIAVAFVGSIRWLVNHYLSELKPNGSTSLKDQVTRLEARVDEIFVLLLAANTPKRKTSKSKGEE